MDDVRFLVIGAGISGLAFADRMNDPSTLVLEADDEIGGYCKTIQKDGFTWDYSGHFFHFRDADIERELVGRMKGQRILKVVKDSRIHWPGANGYGADGPFDGPWIDFPFQKNIHQLPRADFLECLHDLVLRDPHQKPASFLEMLYAKLGKGIAERFLVPYNEKLYATQLSTLDVDAMGRFFPHASLEDIVRNFVRPDNASYNATFTYPEGGAIQYVHALAAGVPQERIALSEPITDIDLTRKIARTDRREIRFEHVVSSAPFPALLRMCGIAAPPEVYSYNQVLVFNLGFDRKGPKGIHWAYYPQRDVSFYRVGFYDNIFGTDRMSLYVELGFPSGVTLDAARISEARDRVLADLRNVGLVHEHRPIAEHHVVMSPAYVHITKASLKDVAEKKALLSSRGVHSIGRYGSWTYCSIEDNIVEARTLADQLRQVWGA
jgi:protoporphyrinogen oxidase